MGNSAVSFPYMRLYTGDWVRDTLHLSCAENGIYHRLVMHCWDQQGPAPLDERRLCGIVNARSGDEVEALRRVLAEFFVGNEFGYFHNRVEKELAEARDYSAKQSRSGKASAEARRAKVAEQQQHATTVKPPLNKRSTTAEHSLNPPTPTPTPTTGIPLPKGNGGKPQSFSENREQVFALGVPLLTAAGVKESNARSMLASLCKKHGESEVVAAITETARSHAGEPVSYIQAILKPKVGVDPFAGAIN